MLEYCNLEMTHSELPISIISPITGNTLFKHYRSNTVPQMVIDVFEECEETFEVNVVAYLSKDRDESIYIACDEDEFEYNK